MDLPPRQVSAYQADTVSGTSLRAHDEALVSWLQGITLRGSHPKIVTAWLSRQFARSQDLHPGRDDKEATPFPVGSVFLSGIAPDPERRRNATITALDGTGTRAYLDETRTEMVRFPWPLPLILTYQVDFWTKTQTDMQIWRTAVMERFDQVDHTYIQGSFGEYGEKILRLAWSGFDDNSDLETGERERVLRNTLSLTLEGWLFRRSVRTKTALKGSVVLLDGKAEVLQPWYCDTSHYTYDLDGELQSVAEDPSLTPPPRVIGWFSFSEDGVKGGKNP
jgi:hypothetical protein